MVGVNKIIFGAIIVASVTACGSVKSDLKSFMKCGIAANQLEKSVASQNISTAMAQYMKKNSIDFSAGDASYLGQEVRDDLALFDKNLRGQLYILAKVYNSSTCRNMHEQEKIKMPFSYYLFYIFV